MIPQMDVILKTVGTNLLTKYVPKLDLDNEKGRDGLDGLFDGCGGCRKNLNVRPIAG